MELSNIKTLLDKYLEAETTLAEEKVLETYFLSDNVAPELEEYKPLFSFFERERGIETSEKIDFKMPFKVEQKSSKRFLLYKWSGIAASVAILVSVLMYNKQQQTITTTSVNHNIAMQNTQDLLLMMTDAVTSSKKQISYLKEINHTKNQLIK